MTKPDIKTNLLDHSEAKVKLLNEYMKRYLNIISNNDYTDTIHVHDLFCGQGLYENGGHGSPLVILKQVKQTHYALINRKPSKKPKINCYFNDIDASKTVILANAVKDLSLHYPFIGDLNLTNEDYKIRVAQLKVDFAKLKKEKAFVFIDPYGYKEIVANDIKDLLGTHKKSEVLLWLPIQFMYRFADEGIPAVLQNLISDLDIETEAKAASSVWQYIAVLKKGFQNFLGTDFYVDHFSLQKEENTVFCLFFFTSHIMGFDKMLESKWEIDTEQGRGWKYTGNSPSLFSDQITNELEDALIRFLGSEKRFNSDVYEFTLRQGYLAKHATQVLEALQKSGRLDVFLSSGEKARKGAFYIKYARPADSDYKKAYFVVK